jgi:hypothetical protein
MGRNAQQSQHILPETYLTTPRSWDTANEPGHGLPRIIKSSRPLGAALKRCHYQNARTPRYHASQTRPPREPRPPPDEPEHRDITPNTLPPPTSRSNKHHVYNAAPKPTHHVDACTTPYSTLQSCPPPWPIKNSIKNRKKYYYGTHTPADTTAKQ